MIELPTVTLSTTQTTFVASAQPDTNFSVYPVLYTGTDVSFQNCISFLKFELPVLPVTSVDSALLQLSVIVKTGTAPSPVVVNRVTSALDTSTVTYNTQPAFAATPSQIDVIPSDLYNAVQIDVTALVNQWLSGTDPNYGFALTNSDATTLVQFATDNIVYEPYFPKLILNYSNAPLEPTGGIQAHLLSAPGALLADNANIVFDIVDINQSSDISYDSETGEFEISAEGNYYITWWVTTDGSEGPVNMVFSVVVNGTPVSTGNSPIVTGQVMGDVLITVEAAPVTVTLENKTGAGIVFANINVQAGITILKMG